MRFQKLTIHNIASIEDAVIDFEAQPLADSEVFLITGKTGAGKSTILDAICLALYANTPRLKNTNMQGESTDGDSEVKVNDPRQLMRRNTVEAFVQLTFVGSNGGHYEATWSVARAYKKLSGAYKGKGWMLKNLDTDVTLTKDAEIKSEIKAAVGLDFSQFCRTTMLAQGEFTRFLNSKDDEKAEILEKITGVDIYSRIGAKVHELTAQKKQEWEEARRIVEGTPTLSDEEIAEKNRLLAELESKQKELKAASERDGAKRDWIKMDARLTQDVNDTSNLLRKAVEIIESEDFKKKEAVIREWNATIDARRWMAEANKAEKTIADQNRVLEGLRQEMDQVTAGVNLDEQEARIKLLETEAAAYRLPELRKEHTEAKVKLVQINTVKEHVATLQKEERRREEKWAALMQQHADLQTKRKEAEEMATPLGQALEVMNTYKATLEKQKDTVDSFSKALRLKLHVGDVCPVCRQEIRHELPLEEDIAAMIRPLEEACRQAEQKYNDLNTQKIKFDAELRAETTAYTQAVQAYENDKAVNELRDKTLQECSVYGIENINEDTASRLASIEAQTFKASQALEANIKEGEGLEKKAKDLREKLDDKRAAIVRLGEKMTTAKTKLTSAEEAYEANKAQLDAFLAGCEGMTIGGLVALNAHTVNDIMRMDAEQKHDRDEVVAKQTLHDNAQKLLAEHQQHKLTLTEDDSLESIQARIEDYERQLEEIGEQKGSLNQELKTDTENKLRLGTLIKEADDKNALYRKWSRLDQLIGNATGSTFRKIAQSYVLTSLVHAANSYMKTLTDRYTLRVTPGTFVISIEDAYQGYTSRAASTISGGDSFLVSLSLALALSDIGQRWQVDTLFIDEGFGTLSGEPLQKAIETLRSLHSKAGRHVGIISHVEELQERIPVQIQVQQEGNNSSSKVKVVP